MSMVTATPPQVVARREPESGLVGCIVAIGMIVFGVWFAYNATMDFARGQSDPQVIQAAEMEFLYDRMNCEPGEVLQITVLPGGAKSVRCAPGDNMPARREPRG